MLAFMYKAQRRRAERGFSLVEILVALVIIVGIGAWAINNLIEQRAKGVDGGVRSDISAMATAQETYITDNPTEQGVPFDSKNVSATNTGFTPVAGATAPKYKMTGDNVIRVGVTGDAGVTVAERGYCIVGYNVDGTRQGTGTGAEGGVFIYDSALGGMQKESTLAAVAAKKGACSHVTVATA